ncbi:hypothetical protein GO730_00500 [Spirosoma sp. HMF3257]|uniref:Uncharacterized protein n=1 Tax=Spirosoma telluris TaxID=2183553 RepID=A0A327NDV4_9BACT|nr:hypothetical protein [Spirosoma telluris]RAI73282.1 hypothetical protein HMF3257_00490 [Spirosoma telluris]
METRFFIGDYYPSIGRPYVIVSAYETGDELLMERFILFKHPNGDSEMSPLRITRPKLDLTLDDFIESEVRYTEEWIFYEIIFPRYQTIETVSYGNYSVCLRPTNRAILFELLAKFSDEMSQVRNSTKNTTLKNIIDIYKSQDNRRTTE